MWFPSGDVLVQGSCQRGDYELTQPVTYSSLQGKQTHASIFLALSTFLSCFTDSVTASAYAAGCYTLGSG